MEKTRREKKNHVIVGFIFALVAMCGALNFIEVSRDAAATSTYEAQVLQTQDRLYEAEAMQCQDVLP